MPRNIGSISAGRYADENLVYWHCLRIDWDASAIEWLTTYPADSLLLDVEGTGTAQTWDGTHDWAPGEYEQGEQTILSISDLTFGNADHSFSDRLLARTNGVKGVRFALWEILFDKADPVFPPTTLEGVWKVYEGEGDREEVGDSVRVGLIALKHPMLAPYPRRMFTPAFGFYFIPPANTTFTWGNGRAEAPPNPSAAHEFPPGTGPWAPTPGPIAPGSPRIPPIRVDPSGRRPRNPGGPRRPAPRTVTR